MKHGLLAGLAAVALTGTAWTEDIAASDSLADAQSEAVATESTPAPVADAALAPVAEAAASTERVRPAPPQLAPVGPHHRLVEYVTNTVDATGASVLTTNRYVELATGMNRWDPATKAYVRAEAVFEELPSGHFVARKTQHQVILPPDLAKEPVDFLAPDGTTRMVSIPLGVALLDRSTGRSVLLGELRACQGHLESPTRVVYPSALEGLEADLVYDLSLSGFEQSIILREQIPALEEIGLDPATPAEALRVIVMTEFPDTPEPTSEARVVKQETDAHKTAWHSPNLTDQELSFGASWRMVEGKAFSVGHEGTDVPVGKAWENLDQGDGSSKRFLLESCDYLDVAPMIQELPVRQASTQAPVKYRTAQGGKLQFQGLPRGTEWKEARVDMPTRLQRLGAAGTVARDRQWAALSTRPGLVLDYSTLNATHTDLVLASSTTFRVTGTVDLYGTTTLEGTVVKFDLTDGGPSKQITVRGPLLVKTSATRPAFFVAKDDDSVGAVIEGSTGNPGVQNYAGYAFRCIYSAPHTIEHVRFRNAYSALSFANSYDNVVRHAQFVSCYLSLWNSSTGPLYVRNVLVDGARSWVFQAPSTGTPAWVGEHLTIHNAPQISRFSNLTLTLTNSLIVEVTTPGTYGGAGNFQTSSDVGLFQSVLAGNFYLPVNSPHRNAGVTGIDPTLQKDFKNLTTSAPLAVTGALTTDTVWTPVAERDADLPNRGYHYQPLDYLASALAINNATLVLTNGVAVGVYGSYGLELQNGGKLVSEGTPFYLNRLVRYQTAQEQATNTWRGGDNPALFQDAATATTLPQARLRFTDLTVCADGGTLFRSGRTLGLVALTDCQLANGNISFDSSTSGHTLALTNSLFDRVPYISLGNGTDTLVAYGRNNLFRYCSINFNAPPGSTWEFRDNFFESSQLWQYYGGVPNGNNAYYSCNGQMIPSGTGNVTVTLLSYATGPFGRYYPSTVPTIVDVGSRYGDQAGLYHYTTQLNQTKEGSSRVDIGFHYPASDLVNIALGLDANAATQSSTVWGGYPSKAVDGNTDGRFSVSYSVTHTDSSLEAWWALDLGKVQYLSQIRVWNRTDAGADRLINFYVFVSDVPFTSTNVTTTLAQAGVSAYYYTTQCGRPTTVTVQRTGRYMRVQLTGTNYLHMAEVQVMGWADSAMDTDGDGLPDYLEDRNGNGTYDAGAGFGETDWNTSHNTGGIAAFLQVYTPFD